MLRSARSTTVAMTFKCVFALVVLGVLAAVNYSLLKRQIEITRPVADVVNDSGEQLMHVQRSVALAKQLVHSSDTQERGQLRAALLETVDAAETTHHRLIRKDPDDAREPPAKVKDIYEKSPWLLDSEVRNFIAQARSLAKVPDAELQSDNPHFRFLSNVGTSQQILDGLNEVVLAYQQQSAEESARLQRRAVWSLGSALGVLALTGIFVFWPMVRRVRADVNELTRLNDTLEDLVATRTAVLEERTRELARSEAALRSQQRILQSILDSMGDGVIVADREHRFLLFNPAAKRLLNIDRDDELPSAWRDRWTEPYGVRLLLPDGETPCPVDQLPLLRSTHGESVDRVELVLRRDNAPDVWLNITSRPLVSDDGEPLGGVAVWRDITERKKAEQELRDSEALYHSLVDNLPMCVLRKDLSGRFTFVNERFCKTLGRESADILGKTDLDLYPKELAEKYRRDDQRTVKTGKVLHLVEENRDSKGNVRYVDVLKVPLRDARGNILGTQAIFWDVTERKKAEREVREMNRVMENAVEGIARVDNQGAFAMSNRAFAAMLGYKPRELRGKRWLKLVHLADHASVSSAHAKMLQSGRARVESRMLRKDGSVAYVELLMLPALESLDEDAGHYLFAKDITDRKEAERRSLQSERLAAVGQMVTAVAHESRNALQQIQACTSMLAWELDADNNDQDNDRTNGKVKELVTDVQQAQDRLHRLFEDLRGYTAPLSLNTRLSDLRDTFRQAWKAVAPLREDRDVSLNERLDELNLSCEHDPFQLEQVFRNLLENSLAACEDPVRIEIACSEATIEESSAIRVAMRDNGPGLSEEQRQKLFDAFYTTKTKGTGLGMAIAKRIVEAHGGAIEVGTTTNEGTEILFTIPRGTP